MNQPLTENEIKKFAAQLRKPDGETGIKVSQSMNDGNRGMNLHTIAVLNPQANDNILEIGMGNGQFVKNIVRIDSSIQYTGCDFSELMVKESSRINAEFIQKNQAKFILANIEKLPLNNHKFNKVFTINTLYFWENPSSVLNELKRVLTPDGRLIIAIRPKHIIENYPVTKYGFSLFSKEDLIELLTNNDLIPSEITEIKEPPQENWGKLYDRGSLIVCAGKK